MKKNFLSYFSKGELALWLGSVIVTVVSHFMSPSGGTLSLAASLIGVTALIFNAKGNPTGPALMVVFALLYGYISFGFAYYGEMLTYVCMSMPMAVFSLVSWLKNPFGDRSILPHIKILKHGKSHLEHGVRDHKFCCGLPFGKEKSVLCNRICRKRRCAHCPVVTCRNARHLVSVGGNLLCGIPCKRLIQLC